MRQVRIAIVLLGIAIQVCAQPGVTFTVEELSKPGTLLKTWDCDEIYQRMILKDANITPYTIQQEGIVYPYNMLTKSIAPEQLVNYGYQSFFNGMYAAYADHRPFVLSPDMIWLLISQGFARHVAANAQTLRSSIVNFDGKMTLIVRNDLVRLDSPAGEWEKVFPEFTKQLSKNTSNDLVNLLSSDFSTTTPVERIASQITIMEAMEPYFEYVVMRLVCGIPVITLKGTPEDWQKIYDKTKQLGAYDLAWWTNELEPILKEFVNASKGNVNVAFWKNMFKYHTQEKYGAPNIIDGWIVAFYPYDKLGRRNNLKQLEGGDNLPEELVKVDLNYVEIDKKGKSTSTPLELWAGFIGLDQRASDFTLTPVIGWMIRKKETKDSGLTNQFERTMKDNGGSELNIRAKEIPAELLELRVIDRLTVTFFDKITIPEKLKNVKIGNLTLNGEITQPEIERIKKLLPHTRLTINGKVIND